MCGIAHQRTTSQAVANVRVHGTTQRVVSEAFAAEKPDLQVLPAAPFDALLKLERRVSNEGLVSMGGFPMGHKDIIYVTNADSVEVVKFLAYVRRNTSTVAGVADDILVTRYSIRGLGRLMSLARWRWPRVSVQGHSVVG